MCTVKLFHKYEIMLVLYALTTHVPVRLAETGSINFLIKTSEQLLCCFEVFLTSLKENIAPYALACSRGQPLASAISPSIMEPHGHRGE